ncbi:lytic transglycosylase domain-containing protein [Brevundimonas sp.]|uniref:lytic transglycosylase domain-containing protein n=1 Tax=Brevundimonas sp. TaxID=1871086 RepID=UPI002FCAF7F9
MKSVVRVRCASSSRRSFFRSAPLLAGLALPLALALPAASHAEVAYAAVVGTAAYDENSDTPSALSRQDRLTYTTAFDALRRGDLETARATAQQVQDRILLGELEFERLFHANHVATYDELVGWLTTYSDLPMAERVYTLAMRRLPDGATPPPRPGGFLARTWDSVTRAGQPSIDPSRAARVMLNSDDLQGAYDNGIELGDWWTSGLAAWRMQRYHDAYQAFLHVADDPTEDPWVRASGAFWAARAAGFSGRQDRIQPLLRQAARWPATFYGQIAQRQLGEEMVIRNQGPRAYFSNAQSAPAEELAPVDTRALNAFVHQDETARRALALFEVGRRNDAAQSARDGLRRSRDSQARQMWADLYRMVAPSRSAERAASTIDASDYPMPELSPEGGYTVDQALVYALIRRESAFDAGARSGAGAYGLMQVMPATAAYMSGDQSYVRQPQRLLNANHNMKVGQDYINRLLAIETFKGDLLKTVASYNAGPGPMIAAMRKVGVDADPLLLIEIIDVPQAREYVEKVVAAYWIYQRMMGGKTNTLDAVVSGAAGVPLSLDYRPPAPVIAAPVIQTAQTETPSEAR